MTHITENKIKLWTALVLLVVTLIGIFHGNLLNSDNSSKLDSVLIAQGQTWSKLDKIDYRMSTMEPIVKLMLDTMVIRGTRVALIQADMKLLDENQKVLAVRQETLAFRVGRIASQTAPH